MNLKPNEAVFSESSELSKDIKLRDAYLLEREQIKASLGGLNQIRLSLGLSQRKICKLLLVDPSAWTRWLKTDAPPHIYQALRWLMEIKNTNPNSPLLEGRLSDRVDLLQAETMARLENLEENIKSIERSISMQATLQPQNEIDVSPLYKEISELNLKIALLTANLERTENPKTQKKWLKNAPRKASSKKHKKSKKARSVRIKKPLKTRSKTKLKTKAKNQKSKSRKKK